MADKAVNSLTSSTPTLDDLTISYDNADTSELKRTTWQLVRDLFGAFFTQGSASSTDNAIARYDSTTGKIIQNSGVIIDDSNNVTGVVGITATTVTTTGNIELGNASDTTLSRVSAGVLAVEGTTIPTISSTNTLTNKSLQDSTTFIVDDSDDTKRAQFQASGITTGTTRTVTIPDKSGTMAMLDDVGATAFCRVYKSGAQSISTTETAITFDVESFDTDTMHDNVTNNTRITFTTAGKYKIDAMASNSNLAGIKMRIRLGGSTILWDGTVGTITGSLSPNFISASMIYAFTAGEYIEILATCSYSAGMTTGEAGCMASAFRIGA